MRLPSRPGTLLEWLFTSLCFSCYSWGLEPGPGTPYSPELPTIKGSLCNQLAWELTAAAFPQSLCPGVTHWRCRCFVLSFPYVSLTFPLIRVAGAAWVENQVGIPGLAW